MWSDELKVTLMKDYSLQCCCLAGLFQIKSSETCSSVCPPLLSSSLIPLPFCFISRPSLNLENWEQHQILLRLNRCEIRKITPATLSLQDMPCLLFAICRCSHHSFLHRGGVFALDMTGTEHTGPRQIAHCRKKRKKNQGEKKKKKKKALRSREQHCLSVPGSANQPTDLKQAVLRAKWES